jgi:hypothetical protein
MLILEVLDFVDASTVDLGVTTSANCVAVSIASELPLLARLDVRTDPLIHRIAPVWQGEFPCYKNRISGSQIRKARLHLLGCRDTEYPESILERIANRIHDRHLVPSRRGAVEYLFLRIPAVISAREFDQVRGHDMRLH